MIRSRYGRVAVFAVVVIAAQLAARAAGKEFFLTQLTMSAYYTLVAVGLSLLMGYAGQISLGQAGFFAIGGYTSAYLTTLDLSSRRGEAIFGLLARAHVLVARPDPYGGEALSVHPWAAFACALEGVGFDDGPEPVLQRGGPGGGGVARGEGERVEVGGIGGLGRTGIVLACMAILAGVAPGQVVEWVPDHYDPPAVETPEQEDWVLWFAEHISALQAWRPAWYRHGAKHPSGPSRLPNSSDATAVRHAWRRRLSCPCAWSSPPCMPPGLPATRRGRHTAESNYPHRATSKVRGWRIVQDPLLKRCHTSAKRSIT